MSLFYIQGIKIEKIFYLERCYKNIVGNILRISPVEQVIYFIFKYLFEMAKIHIFFKEKHFFMKFFFTIFVPTKSMK